MQDEVDIEQDAILARQLQAEVNGDVWGPQPGQVELTGSDQRLVQENMTRGLQEVRARSRTILTAMIIAATIEIIVSFTIIGIYWNDSNCEQPLQLWILLHEVRWFLTVPMEMKRYRIARQGGDTHFIDDIRNFTGMVSFVWLIFGIRFLTLATCRNVLFYTAASLTALSLLWTLLPLTFCLAICVCLPCIIAWMRYFAEPTGITDQMLQELPERTITAKDLQGDVAKCSICIETYLAGDKAKTLTCGHEFHSDCVGHWLKIKGVCPLCRQSLIARKDEVETEEVSHMESMERPLI